MKNSTTNNLLKKTLMISCAVAIWLAVWQIFASVENNDFLFPDIPSTFKALIEIFRSGSFFVTVASTIGRVLLGLLLGISIGIVLAVLSHHVEIIRYLLTPIISIIKSTPVASFIIILWIKLDGGELAIFVAFLMVMPIIWQNLLDGYDAIDKSLDEVCRVYRFSFIKRLRLLVFPTLLRFLIPAIVTATGLAWKSEIAAEIIAYTKNSIGGNISDAKYSMQSPTVFAWTLIVIILSILLEALTKFILRRCKRWASS